MINSYFRKKIIQPVIALLKQGVTPEKLARTFAIGIVVGISPFIGLTTVICTSLAFILRLNPVGTNIANFLVYPIQIILLIPYLQAGSWISGSTLGSVNADVLLQRITSTPFETFKELGLSYFAGLGVWALAALPITLLSYWLMLPLLRKVTPKNV